MIDADNESRLVGVIAVLDIEKLAADGFGDLVTSVENTPNGPKYKFADRKDGLNPLSRHLLKHNINLGDLVIGVSFDDADEDE